MLIKPNQLSMFLWNANGLCGKAHELELLIQQHQPDIFAITETKLNPQISDKEISSHAYTLYRFDRINGVRPGGGVLIGINEHSSIQVNSVSKSPIGEILSLDLNISGFSFVLVAYYHRPSIKQVDDIIEFCQALQNPNILLVGDFNLPEINWSTNQLKRNNDLYMHQSFLEFINSSDLTQHVLFPTHNKGNTLDLIASNLDIKDIQGEPSCSDHSLISFAVDVKCPIHRKAPTHNKTFYLFSKAAITEILLECHDLEQTIKNEIALCSNIDKIWTIFKNNLLGMADRHIPSKKRRSKSNSWITHSTILAIRKRRRMYNTNKNHPSNSNRLKLDEQCRLCKKLVSTDYNNFINKYICNKLSKGQSEPLFRFIASKKGSSNVIKKLDDCTDSEDLSIAVNTTPEFTQDTPIIIHPQGVLKQLEVLDPKKGAGPDLLSPALLKFFAPYIYNTLSDIFQHSLNTGSVPKDWRTANVIPVFKKGSRTDPLNYRPISLTSVVSKLLEHIVSHSIHSHLERFHLLNDCQHGFRSRRGCDTQLINTVTDLIDSYDLGVTVDIAVLDFAKAFDVVSHPKLFSKIENMGIHASTCLWIQNWLNTRSLAVTVNNTISSPRSVTSGVPQGSVLGPLLFLIFINDMPNFVEHSSIKLFADDSLVYMPNTSSDSTNLLQSDLDNLQNWARVSQMRFNVTKCEHLRVSRVGLDDDSLCTISMDQSPLTQVSHIKYLGVTIDYKLTFEQHMTSICKKASGVLHMLMRNLRRARPKTRAFAYRSICRPILEYASQTWSPYKSKHIKMLEQIKRKAFKWAYNFRKYDHISDSMAANNWQTLESRRKSFDIKLYMRILTNRAALNIDKFCQNHGQHYTRGGATVGHIHTDVQKYSFKHRVHRYLS